MLRRPKATDSESDLLREQERFLISGAQSAASVVRRPDKRRGQAQAAAGAAEEQQHQDDGQNQKDQVSIEGVISTPPHTNSAHVSSSIEDLHKKKIKNLCYCTALAI